MATIGVFNQTATGFQGEIKTALLHIANIAIERTTEKTKENSPDFKIATPNGYLGSGWEKKSKEGKTYVSVSLDDPALPGPLYARLMPTEDHWVCMWSR